MRSKTSGRPLGRQNAREHFGHLLEFLTIMGHPVGPYIRGDDCLLCFAAGETPKYIKASFSNTRFDGTYILTQIAPCRWQYGGPQPALRINLEHGAGASRLGAARTFTTLFFDEEVRCSAEFYDEFRFGWGYIWHDTHPAVAAMIGSGYLWSGPNSRYEALYRGDNKWTFGLRNIRVPGNILVQYEP